jgi:hypothetical protein
MILTLLLNLAANLAAKKLKYTDKKGAAHAKHH